MVLKFGKSQQEGTQAMRQRASWLSGLAVLGLLILGSAGPSWAQGLTDETTAKVMKFAATAPRFTVPGYGYRLLGFDEDFVAAQLQVLSDPAADYAILFPVGTHSGDFLVTSKPKGQDTFAYLMLTDRRWTLRGAAINEAYKGPRLIADDQARAPFNAALAAIERAASGLPSP
jgi:hypothetical protein